MKTRGRPVAAESSSLRKAEPPDSTSLLSLRRAAAGCVACPLFRNATQTVFGEGGRAASLMIVGEQPGNQEDLQGHPFVGPAGHLLNELFDELNIPADEIYVTNAVKHFKWKPVGKVRLHQRPNSDEIAACKPWLESEVRAVRPDVVLCLGATAARSVIGKTIPIGSSRGKTLSSNLSPTILISWHPSAILRSPDEESRAQKRAELKTDLKKAWSKTQTRKPSSRIRESGFAQHR